MGKRESLDPIESGANPSTFPTFDAERHRTWSFTTSDHHAHLGHAVGWLADMD